MKRSHFIKATSLLTTSSVLVSSGVLKAGNLSFSDSNRKGESSFWNIFSDDYRKNCKLWKHNTLKNPVVPAGTEPWKKYWTANPTKP